MMCLRISRRKERPAASLYTVTSWCTLHSSTLWELDNECRSLFPPGNAETLAVLVLTRVVRPAQTRDVQVRGTGIQLCSSTAASGSDSVMRWRAPTLSTCCFSGGDGSSRLRRRCPATRRGGWMDRRFARNERRVARATSANPSPDRSGVLSPGARRIGVRGQGRGRCVRRCTHELAVLKGW